MSSNSVLRDIGVITNGQAGCYVLHYPMTPENRHRAKIEMREKGMVAAYLQNGVASLHTAVST